MKRRALNPLPASLKNFQHWFQQTKFAICSLVSKSLEFFSRSPARRMGWIDHQVCVSIIYTHRRIISCGGYILWCVQIPSSERPEMKCEKLFFSTLDRCFRSLLFLKLRETSERLNIHHLGFINSWSLLWNISSQRVQDIHIFLIHKQFCNLRNKHPTMILCSKGDCVFVH
jgi:hypothetical protein